MMHEDMERHKIILFFTAPPLSKVKGEKGQDSVGGNKRLFSAFLFCLLSIFPANLEN